MVVTTLEAYVASEKWGALEQAYQAAIVELDSGDHANFSAAQRHGRDVMADHHRLAQPCRVG